MPGHIDRIDDCIRGWYWDGPMEPARVTVLCRIDGDWQCEGRAEEFRADVQAAGFGSGHCGFTIALPKSVRDGQEHLVEVLIPARPEFSFAGFPLRLVLGTPEVAVRSVEPGDAGAYADFWEEHLLNELGAPLAPEARQSIEHSVGRYGAESNSALFGAWVERRIVGFCGLEGKAGNGYRHGAVLRIALLGPYRGKQLGGRLMEAALAFARDARLRRVELTVNIGNERAKRLYEKFGFRREGVLRDSYFDGTRYSDELLMALILV